MKYILTKSVTTKVSGLEISSTFYENCRSAQEILSHALQIEEKYEILISNYISFENEILEKATNAMVREHLDYSNFFDVRLGVNVQLVNILTSARLYVDQAPQNVRSCLPLREDALEVTKLYFSEEYDTNPQYRFMEALRNYTQHFSIPVHWTTQRMGWTSQDSDSQMEISMDIGASRNLLAADKEFKKKVLAETPEKVDLVLATRSYVESISKVHERVRSLIKERVETARNTIDGAMKKYAEVSGDKIIGLYAFKVEDDELKDPIPLILEWDNLRLDLQKRNKILTNLHRRFVTNRRATHNNKVERN